MNTIELVRLMCDGQASINTIYHMLIQCGHAHEDIHEGFAAVQASGATARTVRVPYVLRSENPDAEVESIGLDEIVLVPA